MKEILYSQIANQKWELARRERFLLISIIYQYYLMDRSLNLDDIFTKFDLDEREFRIMKMLVSNEEKLISALESLLSETWSWTNIKPLIRAILMVSANEILIGIKNIVISEAVEISKSLLDQKEVNFVNALLDNFAKKINK
ncbi:transcription antitermination factor NusB [Mycoplasmopsis agassizii]|uniref:NusB/RsmB/TIM44 domain-containing protein n=1 Tax=Mycoplasmopsis agassizii TaxID=33922 RepID=A0ABX4H5W0_9BACT|nr:transcription antitermination factor NusB [Mycoplasmopsis agassizii]PAF55279.1 hypothetical protein CJF60_01150 [Mycoplasmopsis agassizii]SMC15697.1 NusB family protein [Mycoplasmopsis agassizii]